MPDLPSSPTGANPTPGRGPLCVDLDDTFLKVDTLWECAVAALRQRPILLLRAVADAPRDLALAKTTLAEAVRVEVASLPVRPEVMALIREYRAQGRAVVLATASPAAIAAQVAAAHGCFDEVWASSRERNLKGTAKAEFLAARYGTGQFDYVGDASADLAVWRRAARRLVIAPGGRIPSGLVLPDLPLEPLAVAGQPAAWLRALRPHQWTKNLLVFVPLLTSHRLFDPPVLARAVLAAVSVSLIASALYLLNDILDAPHDRLHPQKRFRPIAAGNLAVPAAIGLGLGLAALSIGPAFVLPGAFAGWLAAYAIAGGLYTFWLKRVFLLDAALLVLLYLVRILMGCAATGIVCSPWLFAFALLLLGSLALLKRYVEILSIPAGLDIPLPGRGAYSRTFEPLTRAIGLTLGGLAALLFLPYMFSEQAGLLYRHALWLAGASLAVGAWIWRAWRLAAQRRMPSDPVVFALTDPSSYALGGLLLLAVWLAT